MHCYVMFMKFRILIDSALIKMQNIVLLVYIDCSAIQNKEQLTYVSTLTKNCDGKVVYHMDTC